MSASLYLGYVFLELRCLGMRLERSIIFPCLAEHKNVRAGRALEHIISDAPGMITGFYLVLYLIYATIYPFKILFSGGNLEMVLNDAKVGVDITTEKQIVRFCLHAVVVV